MFGREHMHRAAFTMRNTAGTTRQFSHNDFGINTIGQHMPMFAIAGNNAIPSRLQGGLQTNRNGFLTDIEMTKTKQSAPNRKAVRTVLQNGGSSASVDKILAALPGRRDSDRVSVANRDWEWRIRHQLYEADWNPELLWPCRGLLSKKTKNFLTDRINRHYGSDPCPDSSGLLKTDFGLNQYPSFCL